MTLAERMIEAREDKGWSKADLCRAAKLKSPSTLTELESGKRTESPQLPTIAAALGVNVLWLQHERGPKHGPADNSQKDPILDDLSRLPLLLAEKCRMDVRRAAEDWEYEQKLKAAERPSPPKVRHSGSSPPLRKRSARG